MLLQPETTPPPIIYEEAQQITSFPQVKVSAASESEWSDTNEEQSLRGEDVICRAQETHAKFGRAGGSS